MFSVIHVALFCARVCTPNTISPTASLSSESCMCAPGFSGAPGACVACPAGSFKVSVGNASCMTCNANATSLAAATHALNCSCVPGYAIVTNCCVCCFVLLYRYWGFVTGPGKVSNMESRYPGPSGTPNSFEVQKHQFQAYLGELLRSA